MNTSLKSRRVAFCAVIPFFFLIAIARLSAAVTALSFDGGNDYVTFGSAPALGAATFTIETWFKRTATGVATSTGTGGVTAIPLVTKGRAEADGTTQDMNYFLGIRASDNVLYADFEEGAEFQMLCEALRNDDARNGMICADVMSVVREGRSPLLLTERT